MSRIHYHSDENIIVEYELIEGISVLHCVVMNWKPSVLRNAYNIFANFLKDMDNLGVSRVITGTPNPRFAFLFGGKPVKQLVIDGKEIEVIVWDLKQ